MATTVDTLLVRIEADMSDLKAKLEKVQRDVDKSTQGISGAFRRLGTGLKLLMGAVVVQQLARAGVAVLGLASDVEEMQGKSSVVFGRFANDVREQLRAFGDEVGRNRYELEAMAASIQDTFVPMGFARGEAAKLSVAVTKLATDTASFNNANDTEVMAAFQSALVGNHETVRRFGVVITEATLKQELLRMGINKTADEITNAEKVQARLNLITNGTTDAHGDAARTSGSFANKLRDLKGDMALLASEIGTTLLPAAIKLIEVFDEAVLATRSFLAAVGIIDLPITEQLAATNAEIEGLEKRLELLNKNSNTDIMIDPSDRNQAGMSNVGAELGRANIQKKLNDLYAEQIALKTQLAIAEPPPAADAGPVDDASVLKQSIRDMIKENVIMKEKKLLQDALNKATKSGNQAEIDRAKLAMNAFDAEVKLGTSIEELVEREIALMKAQGGTANMTQLAINNNAAYSLALDKAKDSLKDLNKASDEYKKLVEDGLQYVKDNIRLTSDAEETLKELTAAYDAGAISASEFKQAQEQIQEKMKEIEPFYASYKDAVLSMSQSISGAFADMLMSGKFNMESLRDTFKSFVRTLIAKAIELFVINRILGSVFGVPMTRTSMGAYVPTNATGGSIQPNTPTLVGERGPELFVPNTGGTIVNGSNTRSALSGGAATIVNQTINVSAGVSQTVRAEMMSLLPRFKQDTMAAVVDAKRRGGSFGQAFG